ncbi:hypothetical protein EMIHUDRAFT_217451 [Emiliania huxleyi CCMP1516]|uniref:Uncharacterized protein n=2 Tax=Emiliania huxleyi TaxID=2903 RepID=A0A0D3IAP8_EMIH1|nr:hypothetical protein EMIHUDRAFT_217451 [Emiliania huxleyi CCMP1516]EOD08333.1 hypothetical protein EMIHUDRAFT_217451 [Emiliania huxleyi CCMP1516]|eukprot:XP_005760762.1 hypothetical protein EMIHUDRAFT_217451 [Emiliania huxleyi CCMP1516]
MSQVLVAPCGVGAPDGDCYTKDAEGYFVDNDGKFLHAKSPDGSSKKLIELLPVTDLDGLSDRVWHFRNGTRAYAAAQDFFDCHDGDSPGWQGLPLMGYPSLGRETRSTSMFGATIFYDFLRDNTDIPFAVFLAWTFNLSMLSLVGFCSDLGFYLANYSAGCRFVTTRCGAYPTLPPPAFVYDSPPAEWPPPVPTDPALSLSLCAGPVFWRSQGSDAQTTILRDKCAAGVDPCSYSPNGYSGGRCSVQCYTGGAVNRTDCTREPAGAVVTGGSGG